MPGKVRPWNMNPSVSKVFVYNSMVIYLKHFSRYQVKSIYLVKIAKATKEPYVFNTFLELRTIWRVMYEEKSPSPEMLVERHKTIMRKFVSKLTYILSARYTNINSLGQTIWQWNKCHAYLKTQPSQSFDKPVIFRKEKIRNRNS